jgi:5-hydroxyisourate hydrolase
MASVAQGVDDILVEAGFSIIPEEFPRMGPKYKTGSWRLSRGRSSCAHIEQEADLGKLTTHVLDTAAGIPAAGMLIRLLKADTREAIREVRTNADGRCDGPLLEGEGLIQGKYVLAFSVGEYFRARGVETADPPFLDIVEVVFGLAETNAHYHVPLLVSPWAYSTYRGS